MKDAKGHGSDPRGAHSQGVQQVGQSLSIAKANAQRLLSKVGINDDFTVKVKAFPAANEDSMALYKGKSQFGSGGPTFWVNEKLPEMMKEYGVEPTKMPQIVADSLSHEYGHVMWEYAQARAPALYKTMTDHFGNDEEKFAEGFAHHINGGQPNPVYDRIIGGYQAALGAKS